jgi:hypothetical protein
MIHIKHWAQTSSGYLSLLAALGIVASLSQKKATITPILLHRYADTSRAPTPGEQGVLGNIGITPTSA